MVRAWNCGNLKQGELGVVGPSSSEKLWWWELGAEGTCVCVGGGLKQ